MRVFDMMTERKGLRWFNIVILTGCILIVVGLSVLSLAFLPEEKTMTITVPPGEDSVGIVKISGWHNGFLSGTVLISGADSVYYGCGIYDQNDNGMPGVWNVNYTVYFRLPLPDEGDYYIRVSHGWADPSVPLTAEINYRVTGIDTKNFPLVAGAIAVGAGLIIAGIFIRGNRKFKESLEILHKG